MYDQLALESVSNTNLGQNLKRAMNKDRIYQPDLEFVIKISMYFNFWILNDQLALKSVSNMYYLPGLLFGKPN